jgi:alpha-methylacyl-CoA racemase
MRIEEAKSVVLNEFLLGIKVLDLSHYLPGPIASLMLGDMGAKVLKVVPPAGDGLQRVGPKDVDGCPIFYSAVNQGKYELTLDLKSETGRTILRQLIASSDVLIEGFRPGTLGRLGFPSAVLNAINVGLIVCSISSYGPSGPLAESAAHDANLLASGGILARNEDCMFDPPIVDGAAALFAALSITAALHRRTQNHGKGCTIDIALSDVMMPLQSCQIAAAAQIGWSPRPRSYYINGGLACYNHYRTADGRRVVLGALEEKFWAAFCTGAARPDWIGRHGEPEPQVDLIREVSIFFGSHRLADLESRFRGIDCCLTPIVELSEAIDSPHYRHRDLVRRQGNTMQALYPARVDGEPPRSRSLMKRINAEEAIEIFRARDASCQI